MRIRLLPVRFWRIALSLLTALFIGGSPALRAQSTNASVSGTVKDNQGGSVPGASVMVKNASTGFQTGTVTNVDGRYLFQQLPLGGPYEVNVSFVGFATQQKQGYNLHQSDRVTVDFGLVEAAQQ
ncbi:MAG: carboxypeptidase regulatory-like domain-containing protein, partial [Ferruginibacter sp.]|nr:carboxypeptidase regulatory-like domain-containing protein [Cytophagales bacterium]